MSCREDSIHLNDYGTAFRITIEEDEQVVDLSDASQIQIIFQDPNGVSITTTGSFVTDGTDGQIQYITDSGFLDVVGTWSIYGKVITSSGIWSSDVDTFRVKRVI